MAHPFVGALGAVAIGALLFAVLLVVVAALVLQERRPISSAEPVTYVLSEASRFVWDTVPDDVAERLDVDDVTRILEWSVNYNQIELGRSHDLPVIGMDDAVAWVAAKLEGVAAADVTAVLEAEKQYLVAIGAVGEPVEGVDG